MDNLRLFIAVDLPERYKAFLRIFREAHSQRGFRWVAEDHWHLTLLFMGNVPRALLDPLNKSLYQCFQQHEPLKLHPQSFDFAPKKRHARMVWLSFLRADPFDKLVNDLYDSVAMEMEHHGYPYEQPRPNATRPHVTLARFKPFDARKAELSQNPPIKEFPPLRLDQCILIASDRLPEGSVYTPLSHFSLGVRH